MSWRTALTLVLLVAAAISGWSLWLQREKAPEAVAGSVRPTYLLTDFELVALDGQGRESFTLRAPQLAQDPGDKTLSLQKPAFLLPDRNGQRWQVRSDSGWVAADNSQVRLRGNVLATSPPTDTPTTMKTEQLNVYPDKHLADSAVLVAVTQPGITMRGTGMRADLAAKRFRLLSNVTMIDDPTRR